VPRRKDETYDVLVCWVASTVQRGERPLQLLLRAAHGRSAAAAAAPAVALRLYFKLFLCPRASTERKQSTRVRVKVGFVRRSVPMRLPLSLRRSCANSSVSECGRLCPPPPYFCL
jgi:hypothetical protein